MKRRPTGISIEIYHFGKLQATYYATEGENDLADSCRDMIKRTSYPRKIKLKISYTNGTILDCSFDSIVRLKNQLNTLGLLKECVTI